MPLLLPFSGPVTYVRLLAPWSVFQDGSNRTIWSASLCQGDAPATKYVCVMCIPRIYDVLDCAVFFIYVPALLGFQPSCFSLQTSLNIYIYIYIYMYTYLIIVINIQNYVHNSYTSYNYFTVVVIIVQLNYRGFEPSAVYYV